MRAMFATWAEDARYPQDLIKPALSHAGGKDATTAAYLRGHRVEERREMMREVGEGHCRLVQFGYARHKFGHARNTKACKTVSL